ncbi:MAG: hypothetical protein Q7T53_00800 [Deltaproteobacteria bacterium]|nr:hypothetical protein [Deltaproteobacteria bacterium]
MTISEKAKEERACCFCLLAGRHASGCHAQANPIMVDGRVDGDRLIEFLTGYNEFINHEPKPFKQIKDTMMKL